MSAVMWTRLGPEEEEVGLGPEEVAGDQQGGSRNGQWRRTAGRGQGGAEFDQQDDERRNPADENRGAERIGPEPSRLGGGMVLQGAAEFPGGVQQARGGGQERLA